MLLVHTNHSKSRKDEKNQIFSQWWKSRSGDSEDEKLARAGKVYIVKGQCWSKYCGAEGTRESQTGCSMYYKSIKECEVSKGVRRYRKNNLKINYFTWRVIQVLNWKGSPTLSNRGKKYILFICWWNFRISKIKKFILKASRKQKGIFQR